jgi:DNA-binding LytR/AlgR family response regulator
MNIGICDDEKICLDRMIECLDKASKALETEFQYKSFLSGEELLKSNENIDILFLDVEMDGISGIETMRLLESKENVKFIIFASSHSEYVFESFGTKTMGFLCKPVEYEKVLKEIKKVIEKINAKKQIEPVEINVDGRNILISPEDIVYISGEKNYVKVVTKDEQYLTYGNMKAWEEKLTQTAVIRIHKSYLVNLAYISNISEVASFSGLDDILPVGRKYKEEARAKYKEYLLKVFREKTNDR